MIYYRQFRKLLRLLPFREFRRGLCYGVAASMENYALMKGISPKTVIDVGANVGQFSLLMRTLHPATRIHAFEPLTQSANRFARLFKGDDLTTLHRCAIGSQPGCEAIHVTEHNDSSSLLMPVSAKTTGVEQIKVRRLEDMMQGKVLDSPILLKLDVQGSELSALQSCGSLLNEVDFVYAEVAFTESYYGQPLVGEVVRYLFDHNFSLIAVNDPQLDKEGHCLQADFLFAHV